MTKKKNASISGSGVSVGTGTSRLTDAKTDPRFGPDVRPLARDIVAIDLEAESKSSWGIVERTQRSRAEQYTSREAVRKAVKAEMEIQIGKQEATRRLYPINKAILIAFQYTPEEIAAKRATGITFRQLYKEARSPHAATVAKEQQAAVVEAGGSKDGETAKGKQKEVSTGWTSPAVTPDNEKTDEDILDILDSYFGGSSIKIKVFMMKLMERSRVKAAIIDTFKEEKL